ncbi:MAG: hypothetical protein MZV65_21360 [Chromatiales bacterium]|nr:hypothetical protein [Chromatiales bacterium]
MVGPPAAAQQQPRAGRMGLGLAHGHAASLLLLRLAWVMGLTAPLFTVVRPGDLRRAT